MRNCFQHPLEGHSETSNNQALSNPFDHYIKMKAYIRVGGRALYQRVDSPPPHPLPQANIDYVPRDKLGEIVSSICLKGFQKLQIIRHA